MESRCRVASHRDGAKAVRIGDEDPAPIVNLAHERDVTLLIDARLAGDVDERRLGCERRGVAQSIKRIMGTARSDPEAIDEEKKHARIICHDSSR